MFAEIQYCLFLVSVLQSRVTERAADIRNKVKEDDGKLEQWRSKKEREEATALIGDEGISKSIPFAAKGKEAFQKLFLSSRSAVDTLIPSHVDRAAAAFALLPCLRGDEVQSCDAHCPAPGGPPGRRSGRAAARAVAGSTKFRSLPILEAAVSEPAARHGEPRRKPGPSRRPPGGRSLPRTHGPDTDRIVPARASGRRPGGRIWHRGGPAAPSVGPGRAADRRARMIGGRSSEGRGPGPGSHGAPALRLASSVVTVQAEIIESCHCTEYHDRLGSWSQVTAGYGLPPGDPATTVRPGAAEYRSTRGRVPGGGQSGRRRRARAPESLGPTRTSPVLQCHNGTNRIAGLTVTPAADRTRVTDSSRRRQAS
eukprot:753140-Hanusia_phi.AAC.1